MRNAEKGFTLIELMITVAIVGILAAIAYPSYTEYVKRSRRVEGQNLLNDAAARQERYRAQNGLYAKTDQLAQLKVPASPNGYYTLSMVSDGTAYTLTAGRALAQTSDTKCGDFTLDDKGAKGMAAGTPGTVPDCWR
ncbi:prepilin-type N-terminal cleavage/methylation domain-containing protein [Variovorax sp. RKNM96]|uniref:type IV pilin protein n=1 Tax=Variovorax sp. RKNM96 TaxID=2681552 RepID=UPI0019825BCD|nr:type IV pilin protein [Variovorax sp. RKNM96]QSI34081.1 prepilin-type N-terminal cleavage/methylation domain-containing protein [Variovorax sp. RKNM96]